jgi:Na+/H+ antiporter NhaD/arsenite permease-like protein
MTFTLILYGLLIFAVYAAIAIGRVPFLRMNRTTIALVGAALLVLFGALNEEQALESLDTGTILLLGSMMVINVQLRLAGFFEWIAQHTLRIARSPHVLLALVIGVSGLLAALFLNDTVCLLFTPLLLDLTSRLKRNPIPYLIGLAASTNVGSTATITGNPQNIIIGQASQIAYLDFLIALAPVAVIGLVVCWGVIVLLYRSEFTGALDPVELPPPRTYPPLLTRTLLVVIGLLIAFLAGLPIVTSACVAAGLLLISRLRPQKLLELDWSLLAFFAGLFIVTGALEVTGLSEQLFTAIQPIIFGGIAPLSIATAVLSNLVSNVPAVLLFRPIIPSLPNATEAWLTLAMASTLAGNLTLLGSVANLIVAEIAAARGIKLTFGEYLRAGVPITCITILIGIVWLSLT